MAWRIEFHPKAGKELSKLDRDVSRRIVRFLRERVALLEDPRSLGEALKGPELGRFWKYRVGAYRLICQIQDPKITILVLRIGHRRGSLPPDFIDGLISTAAGLSSSLTALLAGLNS